MRKLLLLLILASLIIPRLSISAPARMFEFRNREQLSFSLSDQDWDRLSNKVYGFVSSYIADLHPEEPIEVIFDSELECAGFSARSPDQLRQVRISPKIRSHVDFQVVLAHELTHVLRHMYQAEEAYWLDEGLAKWMEWQYIGEFPVQYVTVLNSSPTIRLLDQPMSCDDKNSIDYASSYFFILYLQNHLGGKFMISTMGTSLEKGWGNVERSALELQREGVISLSASLFKSDVLLRSFAQAMIYNDPYLVNFAFYQLDSRYRPTQQSSLRIVTDDPARSSQCESLPVKSSAGRGVQICFQ